MAIMVNFSLHTDSKFIAFIHALMVNSSLRRPGSEKTRLAVWLQVPEGRLVICMLKVFVNVYCLARMMFVVKITMTGLGCEEINMLVVLQMNREFMESMPELCLCQCSTAQHDPCSTLGSDAFMCVNRNIQHSVHG